MISGNCAIGSACIATRPASTVTIAMTMATIGRPMKNRDTSVSLWCVRERLHVHDRSIGRGRAFHHDALPRLETAIDDPAAAHSLAGLHSPRRDLVAGVDGSNLVRPL